MSDRSTNQIDDEKRSRQSALNQSKPMKFFFSCLLLFLCNPQRWDQLNHRIRFYLQTPPQNLVEDRRLRRDPRERSLVEHHVREVPIEIRHRPLHRPVQVILFNEEFPMDMKESIIHSFI